VIETPSSSATRFIVVGGGMRSSEPRSTFNAKVN